MIEEIWRDVKDFEGHYEISSLGKIRGNDRYIFHSGNDKLHYIKGKDIKTRVNNCGYLSVRLNKNGKSHTRFVHRILAQAFIDNFNDLPFVNHKNGLKRDNSLGNLEWVTHKQNVIRAYKMGLMTRSVRNLVLKN